MTRKRDARQPRAASAKRSSGRFRHVERQGRQRAAGGTTAQGCSRNSLLNATRKGETS
jgi:hypothetical protein